MDGRILRGGFAGSHRSVGMRKEWPHTNASSGVLARAGTVSVADDLGRIERKRTRRDNEREGGRKLGALTNERRSHGDGRHRAAPRQPFSQAGHRTWHYRKLPGKFFVVLRWFVAGSSLVRRVFCRWLVQGDLPK